MAAIETPEIVPAEKAGEKTELEPGYLVVCWNDPVNFMEFVTHVFQTVFGWNKVKAERHMLEVHNQGTPIQPDLLPHLFEAFQRGPDAGGEGLGLGLYIVKQIVDAHGGSITVRSSQAEGTTFSVLWPAS